MRSFTASLVSSLVISLSLVGCDNLQPNEPLSDTGLSSSEGSSGYTMGSSNSSGSSSSDDEDVDTDTDSDSDTDSDTDADSDTDTDSDTDSDTDADTSSEVTATVWVHESTSSTAVCLFSVANVTTGDYTGYGTSCADDGDGWLSATVTYVPGQVLSLNGWWTDGTVQSDGTATNRYLAEHGNVVNIMDWVQINYEDGTNDQYEIDSTGTKASTGYATFVATSTGGDVDIFTQPDAAGEYVTQ